MAGMPGQEARGYPDARSGPHRGFLRRVSAHRRVARPAASAWMGGAGGDVSAGSGQAAVGEVQGGRQSFWRLGISPAATRAQAIATVRRAWWRTVSKSSWRGGRFSLPTIAEAP